MEDLLGELEASKNRLCTWRVLLLAFLHSSNNSNYDAFTRANAARGLGSKIPENHVLGGYLL